MAGLMDNLLPALYQAGLLAEPRPQNPTRPSAPLMAQRSDAEALAQFQQDLQAKYGSCGAMRGQFDKRLKMVELQREYSPTPWQWDAQAANLHQVLAQIDCDRTTPEAASRMLPR